MGSLSFFPDICAMQIGASGITAVSGHRASAVGCAMLALAGCGDSPRHFGFYNLEMGPHARGSYVNTSHDGSEIMASGGSYLEKPNKKFLVIDAPLEEGETL